ncbi:MAG: hypothetical protein KY432_09650, partial [Acidobacteria bacterium]|nr:hypothetical protein [Acidobacteriota bacterium]
MLPKKAEDEAATSARVTLPAPHRGCGCFLIALLFVELISALFYHLSAALLGDFSFESFQRSVIESMSLGVSGALALLAGIIMSGAWTRLRVEGREFRMRRALGSTEVHLNRATDLWFYPSFPDLDPKTGAPSKRLAGSYCLEDDEQSLLFKVHPNQLIGDGVRHGFEQLLTETER